MTARGVLCAPGLRRLAAVCAAFVVMAASPRGLHASAGETSRAAAPGPSVASSPRTDLVVVAPHPDDAVLLAAGALLRARQAGERVAVIVLTNGDFDCRVDGLVRERESVGGLGEVGVDEDSIYFLGYPDGYLARLGRKPLPPVPRLERGACTLGNRTYGARGHGRRDVHASSHGAPATYTAENAVEDLALLLARLRPRVLIVTHPNDIHPDHAAAYVLVRRAMDRASLAPSILTGVIHDGDCWPTGAGASAQCPPARTAPGEPMPPLTGALAGYGPELRLDVPSSCLARSFERNPKLRAIAAHHSQTHDDPGSYLFAFARRDELFFAQSFARAPGGRYEPVAGDPATLGAPSSEAAVLPRGMPQILVRARVASRVTASAAGYTLLIDAHSREASVFDSASSAAPRLLRRWLLPHDSLSGGAETFTLEREYTAGNAVELALYEAGVLVGVHVAVRSPSPR